MAESKDIIGQMARSGRMRVVAALAVTALVGGSLSVIMLRGGGGNQALLYSGLDLTESAEIAGELDRANIRYQIRGDGASIFVDRAQVLDARMMLSEEGLPTRGALGYEIFDKTEALGTTSFVQNINRVRALEGELARTVASLDIVRAARVHLVLPERRLFERDSQKPTASVVLSVAGHGMTSAQVRAIRNLVAGSVPGLQLNSITVLDDQGRLLAAGSEEGEDGFGGANADERKTGVEEQLRRKVLEVVESVTGPGAARVQISADIDFNRITQSSENYDPEGRVVRSSTTSEESNSENTREPVQTTTAANNVPGDAGDGADAPTSESNSSRVEETTNYEISKTTKTEIIEGGRIRRLSVAVALDDTRLIDEEGASTFTPRTEEEIARITALVRSAVGYEEARGDTLEVVNVSFARPDISMEGGQEKPGLLDLDKNDLMRITELVILLLGALMLIMFVLRPLVKGLIAPPGAPDSKGGKSLNSDGAGAGAIGLPDNAMAGGAAALGLPGDEDGDAGGLSQDMGIDVARISGQVKASSINKISEVVEQHPDESLQIIRNWLSAEDNRSDAA